MDVKLSDNFNANDPRLLDSIFNISSIDTNILILAGGLLILGFVIFEVAFFSMDVYSKKTSLLGGIGFGQKIDNQFTYPEYPPYRDPFLTTYRSAGGSELSLTKIVEWIYLMHDIWNFGDSSLNSLECQKRTLCEIWRPENSFPHTDFLDLFFKYADTVNPPDGVMDFIDELSEARMEAPARGETCESLYSDCPAKTLTKLMDHFRE
eukprot:TRINITY_DN11522_c0_g1_i1.p1 TRINITY_DN11522_c0_g1~~TRINITY_DN11522_c0_g1_i1.p1  ORF type:complete len:207 (-),score=31.08 TRINITY_DN11522_c0_g1_i1:49-669(-)